MPGLLAAVQAAGRESKKRESESGGFFGLKLPNLGLREAAAMIPQAVGGIGRAVGALAPGGTAAGEPWAHLGRGALGGMYATQSRFGKLIPGVKEFYKDTDEEWANYVASKAKGGTAEKRATYAAELGNLNLGAYRRGFVPALINDVGTVSIAGGIGGKLASSGKLGTAAKGSLAAERAARVGLTAEELAKATDIAKAASPTARATAGVPILRRYTAGDLASVSRPAREFAEGQLAGSAAGLSDAAIASRADLLRKLEATAHPYQGVARNVISPLSRAGQEAQLAGIAGEPGAVPDVPPSGRIGPAQRAHEFRNAQPIPEWAQRAVETKAGKPLQGALASIEGGIQRRGLHRVSREQARFVDAARREETHGAAARGRAKIAEDLVGAHLADGTELTPQAANEMVAQEVMARVAGQRQMLPGAARQFAPAGVPDELLTPELNGALDEAAELYRAQAVARRQELISSSRKGEKGLEGATSTKIEPTAKQARQLKALEREAARLAKLGPKAQKELAKVRSQIAEVSGKIERAATEHERIMQRLDENRLAAAENLNPNPDIFDPSQSIANLGETSLAELARTLKQRRGESTVDLKARAYRLGRQVEREQNLLDRVARIMRTGAELDRTQARLYEALTGGTTPTAKVIAQGEAKLARGQARVAGALENPTIAQVPGPWKPLWGSFQEWRKAAVESPELAAMLGDFPDQWSAFIARAQELGIDPEHIASLTDNQVRQLITQPTRLGKMGREFKEIESGTRKTRRGAQARTQTLEALAAARVDVVHEAASNELVSYIERTIARPVLHDDVGAAIIPKGWHDWDPTRTFLTHGEAVPEGRVIEAGQGQPRLMIPDAVHTTIRNMSGDYSHSITRGISKVTKPWQAFLLTWSPRWYVNNVMGNSVLAASQGVRLDDWLAAWHDYRGTTRKRGYNAADVAPEGTDAVGGVSLYSDLQGEANLVSGPKGVKNQAKLARSQGQRGVKAGYTEAARKMRRANEVVDDMARTAMYLSKRRGGLSPEASVQAAVKNLVDYNDLSPWERQVVRSVVPFYAWQKGVFKIVTKLPIEHPAAAAFTMQLAKLNEELQGPMPDWYAAMFRVPGTNLSVNTRSFNPFADAASLATPQGIAAGINPFVELGARNALGAPENGFVEEYRMNEFGQAVPDTSPARDLSKVLLGLPQTGPIASTIGLGRNERTPGAARGIAKFFGAATYTPEQQDTYRARVLDSEQVLETGNPYAKVKRKAGSKAKGAGSRFRRSKYLRDN